MHEPLITVVGNVARPPKLRSVASGHVVADFRLASTPRALDKASSTWGDGETIWFGVTVWRALAEHCAESLKTGDRVIVQGRLVARVWKGEDGVERSGLEIDALSVGLDLSRGTASYRKGAALSLTEDPWVSSGEIDPETGEVQGVRPGDADHLSAEPAA